MIQKLVNIPKEEFTPPIGVTDVGSFNLMPEPFEEISRDEYLHRTGPYTMHYLEFRQVRHLAPHLASIYIEWYAYNGYAVMAPNKWHTRREDEGEGYGLVWEEDVRYFRIGCPHKWKNDEKVPRERGIDHLVCETCLVRKSVAYD